jgi:hypothetical protein
VTGKTGGRLRQIACKPVSHYRGKERINTAAAKQNWDKTNQAMWWTSGGPRGKQDQSNPPGTATHSPQCAIKTMQESTRRKWHKTAKLKGSRLTRGARDAALCAQFQARLTEGGTVRSVAKEMGITERTAYRWAATIRFAAAEWLRREGWNEAKLVQAWIAQAERSRGHVLNGALREIGLILDVYPVKKNPAPLVEPVQVIFCTDLKAYENQRYADPKADAKTLQLKGQQSGNDPPE